MSGTAYKMLFYSIFSNCCWKFIHCPYKYLFNIFSLLLIFSLFCFHHRWIIHFERFPHSFLKTITAIVLHPLNAQMYVCVYATGSVWFNIVFNKCAVDSVVDAILTVRRRRRSSRRRKKKRCKKLNRDRCTCCLKTLESFVIFFILFPPPPMRSHTHSVFKIPII